MRTETATTASSTSVNRSPVNPWFIFILICTPILIGAIDLTAIVVVLPQATLDILGPKGLDRADQALWAATAYLLAYTISLALVGRLSDVLPRKQVFIACIVIFIVGALWSALATDLPLQLLGLLPIWPDRDALPLVSLVIGRVIQATGAGASVSVGMALVSDVFPPEKRAEPISLIGALDSLGWVIGNLYAGLMLQILPSWRWLFLINAGVAGLALVLTVLALRYAKAGPTSGRFDWRGAALFAAALMALTIGVETLGKPTPATYALLGGSVGLLALFFWLQWRTRHALIDMQFVRGREVRAALLTNLIMGFGLILVMAGVPLVINLRAVFLRGEGLLTGALRAGIMLCAVTVPLIAAVLVGEGRYRRIGAGVPVSLGLGLAALGFLGASLWTYTAPSHVIAIPLAFIGVGLGLTIGPLSLVVVDAAEESARGLASSLVLVMRLLGMTIGTPLAATLTLSLANAWADAQAATLTDFFRVIARPMLVPPMAVDALARIMLIGAAACLAGLLIFYLPRALRTLRQIGPGPRAVLSGMPTLALVVALVGGVAAWDSQVTPTVLPNPIARQLPPNVDLYAGLNIQQAFLLNSRRPLDAMMNLLNELAGSAAETAAKPGAGAASPLDANQQPGELPPEPPPPDTPTDSIIKLLFQPREWSNAHYRPFCPADVGSGDWQWCFNNALLSWIGPQAAFALLPRTRADYDYLFVFQATNRNNAIQFAANLATALGEPFPDELRPNVRVLEINAGLPQARSVAITDAYVMVGTPKAIDYTLNHGSFSLADQPDYQAITGQLPANDFATVYFRSANFETDLRLALASLFDSPVLDAAARGVARLTALAFPRTSAAPALVGIGMRVNEAQLTLSIVASLPVSLQKLNASPVPPALLGSVPANAQMWAAMNLNIAGIVRDINIAETLRTIARESGSAALADLLAHPMVQGPVMAAAGTLQKLLTHAEGPAVFVALPGRPGPVALLLSLADRETTAAETLQMITNQLRLFDVVAGGAFSASAEQIDGFLSEVVTLGGEAIEPLLPGGLHYALTSDNLLVIAAGASLPDLVDALRNGDRAAAEAQISASLPGPLNRFLYAYLIPASPHDAALLIGGQIRRQTLYLDAVLQTKE